MDSVNRKPENTDDVLVKYLLGEATDTEQQEVEQWIADSAENKKHFDHFKLIWDESKHLASQSTVDENEAWDRFMAKVKTEEKAEAIQPKGRAIPLGKTNWMRAAAALVLLIGCGAIYYFAAGPGSTITTQAGDVAMSTTLPDGSVVTLNRNSSISYPTSFSGGTRHVVLKGEAFFNVTPDKTKPFIIDADNSSIKVVGTSFNVKSNDDKTEVVVETGIVEVAKKQYAIRVLPHQKAIVLKQEQKPVMENSTDVLYNYYRTKEFVCDHTPLYKLTDILNEAFDVHIVIATPTLKNIPINSTYHEQSLDAILENIKMLTGATVEKNGSEIILK
ncbi:iron dicitrate transport regulator FecR [Flavipsychrobacter stenotrophus]|uniref:Iron dicitrate transport regulator FecR n=1 Tax=Flavipsychrobacter stenotrophus TaxID=2077091 RepID=A0A2S7SZP7_9BACT|nr:iron dicitrate transport regulator FecR [Flavipsychrobacter stenotrophus]